MFVLQSSRDRTLAICLIIVLVTAVAYWRVRGHDFITYDDSILVYENSAYRPLNAGSLAFVWKHPHEQIYTPLTYTVWAGLFLLAKVAPAQSSEVKPPSEVSVDLDPGVFHSFNLALHIVNSLLVFALLRSILRAAVARAASPLVDEKASAETEIDTAQANIEESGAAHLDWAALCGALFWALHPLQVESVAWVAELKGVLSGFWGLLALWAYLTFASTSAGITAATNGKASSKARSVWFYGLAMLSFVLALLAKPAAVCLPLAAGVLDVGIARRSLRQVVPALLPWLVAVVPIVVIAQQAQPSTSLYSPLWGRPFVALDALAFYIGKIVWPVALSYEYSRDPATVLKGGYVFWTWVLPLAVAVLLWRWKKRVPLVAAGLFIALLCPVLGLIKFVFQYYSTVADRYVYLPMLAPSLLLAWLLWRLTQSQKRSWAWGAAGAYLLLLGVLCYRQTGFWKNSETLYNYTLSVHPRAWAARINLGALLVARGKYQAAQKLYLEAIEIRPNYAEAYACMGQVLAMQKKYGQAFDPYLLKATELSPTDPVTYLNMGAIYNEIKRHDYAVKAFRRGVQIDPHNPRLQMGLAETYLYLRQPQKALEHFAQAKDSFVNPESFYISAATITNKTGYHRAAIPFYVQALQIRPDNPNFHNDLGVTLLQLKNYRLAEKAFRRASSLDPNYVGAHSNLALALMRQHKLREAREHLRIALKLKPGFKPAQSLWKDLQLLHK